MKLKLVCIAIIFGTFVFSCESKLSAEAIVEKSLKEAHGGKAQWEAHKVLRYEKSTTLYDSSGKITLEKKQTFHNTLQPEFTSKVIWKENDEEHRIVFDGEEIYVFIDGFQVTDDEKVAKAHKEIMGAHYVFWQPYKLATDDVSLSSEGKVKLDDGSEAYKIKAVYPDSETIWWYYFDTETFQLKENLVKHGKTYSQIKNLQHEAKTGLFLNKERKSYMIDSTKNQKYLRAHYQYNILELK
ncbi:hypothetical protein U8527_01260 [Kordia algicida OT-1]|uniref:Lipoprotein n=1 Tax=Kordia algicida OT-1 TaxID=391587 RepID=A9DSF1_9FLAO|nr:hypothetical protein [Kordia algicida]EDP96926.1 hypothetical protein KAOT1_17223 [Kordia algicida OT-1]